MEVLKRKVNGAGASSTNGHKKKKSKKIREEDEVDLDRAYFESEIVYHSTVTKMKVRFVFLKKYRMKMKIFSR